MSDVPSVNPDQPEIPDSDAGKNEPFVDPVFLAQNPERLPDEPEPTAEEIAAAEAEKAAAEEAERKERGELSKKELKKLLDEIPDDDEPAEEAGKGEQPGEAAEEAKKTAEQADKDGEEEGGDAGEAKGEDGKKPRRRSKGRRERRAMERKMAALEAEIAELKGGKQQPAADQAPAETEEVGPQPKLEDFETAEEWATAFGDWTKKTLESSKKAEEATKTKEREEAAKAAVRERIEAFEDREDEFRELHDDYDDVTRSEDLTITPDMAIFLQESEFGPHIAYHLGNNPDEADEIAGLSPIAQIKRLTRIEARLEAEQAAADTPHEKNAEKAEGAGKATSSPPQQEAGQQKPKPKPRPETTKAPDPVPTVGGGGSPPRRDPAKMSFHEYEEGRLSGKIR